MPAGQRWKEQGLCGEIDPDLFFSENADDVKAAKQVCGTARWPNSAANMHSIPDPNSASGVA